VQTKNGTELKRISDDGDLHHNSFAVITEFDWFDQMQFNNSIALKEDVFNTIFII
jgi:hypothetical protein